jgi:hypothetical protein
MNATTTSSMIVRHGVGDSRHVNWDTQKIMERKEVRGRGVERSQRRRVVMV